jgi:hypothetical protein
VPACKLSAPALVEVAPSRMAACFEVES